MRAPTGRAPSEQCPTGRKPGRPADRKAETRQRILDAAGQLFRTHGVDGVGVDAVMQQAGLTHGGFYLHFPSKEALAAAVAQSLLEKAAARWDRLSRQPDDGLRQIVQSYLDPAHALSNAACPLTTLGTDVARRSTSRSATARALDGMLDALARCAPGQRRDTAVATLCTMVGAVVLARLADDPALAKEFLADASASLLPDTLPSTAVNHSGTTARAPLVTPSD